MHKTILVIGEVTRDQYQPVRREIMRDGHQPKIVRVSVEQLFLEDEELVNLYGSENSPLNYNAEWYELYLGATGEWFEELAAKHIATYGVIAAIVMTHEAYERWGGMANPTAVHLREHDDVRWVIGEQGSLEYIGG